MSQHHSKDSSKFDLDKKITLKLPKPETKHDEITNQKFKGLKIMMETELGIIGTETSIMVSHGIKPSKGLVQIVNKKSKKLVRQMDRNMKQYSKMQAQIRKQEMKNEIGMDELPESFL
jgi:hypothetical protein